MIFIDFLKVLLFTLTLLSPFYYWMFYLSCKYKIIETKKEFLFCCIPWFGVLLFFFNDFKIIWSELE